MSRQKEWWKQPTTRSLPKEQGEPDIDERGKELLEAQPTEGVDEGGSLPTNDPGYTAVPNALADVSTHGAGVIGDTGEEFGDESGIAESTVRDASDASLGLTNIGDINPQDWAANTGPTITEEENHGSAAVGIANQSSTLRPEAEKEQPGEKVLRGDTDEVCPPELENESESGG